MSEEPVPLIRVHRAQLRVLGMQDQLAELVPGDPDFILTPAESKIDIALREGQQAWIRWYLLRLKQPTAADIPMIKWLWQSLPKMPDSLIDQLAKDFNSRLSSSNTRASLSEGEGCR